MEQAVTKVYYRDPVEGLAESFSLELGNKIKNNPRRAVYHFGGCFKLELAFTLSNQAFFTSIIVHKISQGPFFGLEDNRHGLA